MSQAVAEVEPEPRPTFSQARARFITPHTEAVKQGKHHPQKPLPCSSELCALWITARQYTASW